MSQLVQVELIRPTYFETGEHYAHTMVWVEASLRLKVGDTYQHNGNAWTVEHAYTTLREN